MTSRAGAPPAQPVGERRAHGDPRTEPGRCRGGRPGSCCEVLDGGNAPVRSRRARAGGRCSRIKGAIASPSTHGRRHESRRQDDSRAFGVSRRLRGQERRSGEESRRPRASVARRRDAGAESRADEDRPGRLRARRLGDALGSSHRPRRREEHGLAALCCSVDARMRTSTASGRGKRTILHGGAEQQAEVRRLGTLEEPPPWSNSRLPSPRRATGPWLRSRSNREAISSFSAAVSSSGRLIHHGLVDEYVLLHPSAGHEDTRAPPVLARRRRTALRLVDAKASPSGVVITNYQSRPEES